ncbi:MAG: hypothetical protein R3Y47_00255 [Lachnospiraceae bacterium]
MNMFLLLFSGIAWSIVYIDSIRVGFRDKTFAMPLWALGLNIAWEILQSIFGFIQLGIGAQICVNAVWAIFDIFILITYFKYGYKHFPKDFSKKQFYLWGVLVIAISFIIQYMFIVEFPISDGASYAAYIQNIIMSVLFIGMLVQRDSSEGQTKLIAYAKFLGTLAPTILIGLIGGEDPFKGDPSSFVFVLGLVCAVFDIIYIIMLTKKQKDEVAANFL